MEILLQTSWPDIKSNQRSPLRSSALCSPPTALENKPILLVQRGKKTVIREKKLFVNIMYHLGAWYFSKYYTEQSQTCPFISHQRAKLWHWTFLNICPSPHCSNCFVSPSEHIAPFPGKGGTFAVFANTELQPCSFICPCETYSISIQYGGTIPSWAAPVPLCHFNIYHCHKYKNAEKWIN